MEGEKLSICEEGTARYGEFAVLSPKVLLTNHREVTEGGVTLYLSFCPPAPNIFQRCGVLFGFG